jgi:predicted permease
MALIPILNGRKPGVNVMLPVRIFLQIVLPVFILLSVGFALDRAFPLDIQTLTRVSFYVITPALVFLNIVESDLDGGQIMTIIAFVVAHDMLLMLAAFGLFSLKPFRSRRKVLSLGSVMLNAGNYGFPFMLIAFGEWAVGVVAILLITQVVEIFTFGVALFAGGSGVRQLGRQLARLPVLYAVALGFVVRALSLPLIPQIEMPLNHLANAFIGLALVTLGAQLSRSRLAGSALAVLALAGMNLAFSPLLAAGMAAFFPLRPDVAQVLIVATGLPMAVNVFILAKEFDRDAELASQMVFWTTLLSAVTLPVLLSLVRG